jgi:SNF2 family DNA or RNA helicase
MLRKNKSNKYEYGELFIVDGYKTKARKWDTIIFDEAHYLKGHQTKTTKGAKRLISEYIFLLTATPVINTPDELYALLNILNPKRYKSYWRFVDIYCETEKVWGCAFDVNRVIGWKKGMDILLKKELKYVMFRKEKEEVLEDLPDKIFKRYKIKMKGNQKKAYDQMEEYMATKTIDDILQVEGELSKLLRLRQIAADPNILNIEGKSAKTEFLLELLPNMDGQIIIMSWFKSYTKLVYNILKKKGFSIGIINGDVSIEDRTKIIQELKSKKLKILIGTYSTLSTGLNLQFVHNMIMLDKPWSSMELEQAQGRIYRNGQKHSCLFISLITEGTIEEDMEQALFQKTKIISKLISVKSILEYFKKRVDKKK